MRENRSERRCRARAATVCGATLLALGLLGGCGKKEAAPVATSGGPQQQKGMNPQTRQGYEDAMKRRGRGGRPGMPPGGMGPGGRPGMPPGGMPPGVPR